MSYQYTPEEIGELNVEIDRLRAALAEAQATLSAIRVDLAPIHVCDVVSSRCAICAAVLRIDAFLSPQEAER